MYQAVFEKHYTLEAANLKKYKNVARDSKTKIRFIKRGIQLKASSFSAKCRKIKEREAKVKQFNASISGELFYFSNKNFEYKV